MRVYKIAQGSKESKEKKPYNIIRICWGKEEVIGSVRAFSSEQARMFALQNNIKDIQASLEVGCTIVARLDRDKWEQEESSKNEVENLQEKQIQDAWWQK
jgi:hypothetical protein